MQECRALGVRQSTASGTGTTATTGLIAQEPLRRGGRSPSATTPSIGSLMPGVIAAARAVSSRPGLTLGIDDILGLSRRR